MLDRIPLSARVYACAYLLAACGEQQSPPAPIYARATANIQQIRPRTTVDPDTAVANDVNAVTAQWPIHGAATFLTTDDGVDVTISLKYCRTGYLYPVSLHETSDCSTLQLGAASWDGERGELPAALCLGSPGARVFHTRRNDAMKPWTLGGSAASNLIGRTLAIRDPDSGEPLACGKIDLGNAGALARPQSESQRPADDAVLEATGLCLFGFVGQDPAAVSCPKRKPLADCVFSHCVVGCLDVCSDYLRCVEGQATACGGDCIPADECNTCLNVPQCPLGFCGAELACMPPPTPDGPCKDLRECCQRQGPLVSGCLAFVDLALHLGGDASCLGALSDWDFNTNVAYRSPCYPDGGMPEE